MTETISHATVRQTLNKPPATRGAATASGCLGRRMAPGWRPSKRGWHASWPRPLPPCRWAGSMSPARTSRPTPALRCPWHRAASLDHPVPPADARRIARPRDRRCTPRHGSWLTIAELELRVLSSQGLRQRLPERAARDHAVAAWIAPRNAHHLRVHWRFSPEDARRTMLHLYPLPGCVTYCLTRH